LFSFPALLGVLLVAGVLRGSGVFFVEGDTWWHIQVGADILRTHTWPTTDSYSFTVHGNEWIAYEWLGEVAMALAERLGDVSGLMVLLVGLGSTLLLLLYYYAFLRCGNAKAAFVACLLMLPFVVISLRLRPQLFGYMFLLMTLICLEQFRQGQDNRLWILPAIFLCWVNTHPTFGFGLMALGLYWIGGLLDFRFGGLRAEPWTPHQRRGVAAVSLACVLTLAVTPYGPRLVGYFLDLALFQPVNVASIHEWQPLGHYPAVLRLFLAFLLPFLVAQVALRPSWRLEELLLFAVAVFLTFVHMRFLFLFVLVFAPRLAALLGRWLPPYEAAKDRYTLNAVLMLLITALLVWSFPRRPELQRLAAYRFPRGAVQYVKEHPAELAGRMFNTDYWGAYLTRSLGAAHRVFIDGRVDAYEPAGVLSDYLDITGLKPDTLLLLRKYGIEVCLIETESPLATLLANLPGWKRVYEDNTAVIFVRKKSGLVAETRSKARDPETGNRLDSCAFCFEPVGIYGVPAVPLPGGLHRGRHPGASVLLARELDVQALRRTAISLAVAQSQDAGPRAGCRVGAVHCLPPTGH
jgi:hypothetical protein